MSYQAGHRLMRTGSNVSADVELLEVSMTSFKGDYSADIFPMKGIKQFSLLFLLL